MPSSLENISARGNLPTTRATPRSEGLCPILSQLVEEHMQLRALLTKAVNARAPSRQRNLWSTLRRELLAHERAEVAEVDRMLATHPDTQHIAARNEGQVARLEAAIQGVDSATYGTEDWNERVHALRNLIKAHLEEEEMVLFPKAQRLLNHDEMEIMRQRYVRARRSIASTLSAS